MCAFKEFLRRFNNKDAVPTLEFIQKLIEIHHKKGNDTLNHGTTLLKRSFFLPPTTAEI